MRMFAFKQFPFLTDGELSLIHDGFLDGDSAMERVPAYIFKIIRNQDKMPVGDIDIRIGLTAGRPRRLVRPPGGGHPRHRRRGRARAPDPHQV